VNGATRTANGNPQLLKSELLRAGHRVPAAQRGHQTGDVLRHVARRFEGGTARPPQRIGALRSLELAGYRVGPTIAPIMPIPRWRDSYGALARRRRSCRRRSAPCPVPGCCIGPDAAVAYIGTLVSVAASRWAVHRKVLTWSNRR
jgi:hypothetical protein